MKILLINGSNLNVLAKRDPSIYGKVTLKEIVDRVQARAKELGVEVQAFQSNSEGAIIDFLQLEGPHASGIIINPGALTHYGLSLREALAETGLPVVEVRLSNIHAREWWRRRSVVADVARAQVSGLGWRSYLAA